MKFRVQLFRRLTSYDTDVKAEDADAARKLVEEDRGESPDDVFEITPLEEWQEAT